MKYLYLIFLILAFIDVSISGVSQNCSEPEKLQNGRITTILVGKGKLFFARCNAGFYLDGVRLGKCMSENQWNFPFPSCVRSEEKTCNNLKPPIGGRKICDPDSTVPVQGSICVFDCGSNYILKGSRQRVCQENLTWSGIEAHCVDKNEEDPQGCPPPPPLQNGSVLGCLNSTEVTIGQYCYFRCNPGFRLRGPSILSCSIYGVLLSNNGRQARPACISIPSPTAQQFSNTQRNIHRERRVRPLHQLSTIPCSRAEGCDRTCLTEQNGVKEGFKWCEDTQSCLDIDECYLEPHRCEHKCVNTMGSYRCVCHPGYRMNDNNECEDIDECAVEEPSPCDQICENKLGTYRCLCRPGYVLVDGRKCEGCGRSAFWSELENRCVQCPENSHTESDGKSSIADCVCDEGFSGNPGENIVCRDIDECAVDNYNCSHYCINTPGDVHCSCPLGFELDHDNKTCVDIDECKINNGGCEGLCHNHIGNFSCTCEDGYTISKASRYLCDDIDECAVNNGDCSDVCINYPSGYYCSCSPGFRIDGSQKNCNPITCPNIPAPHYSTKHCKIDNNKIQNELQEYEIGTVCTFRCFNGFKLDSVESIKCDRTGSWSGSVPKCIAQTCPPLVPPKHGDILPASCTKGLASVKEKCTYTCKSGYILKTHNPVVRCQNDLTWTSADVATCEPRRSKPFISCPNDITIDLEPLQNSSFVTVPEPETNVKNYVVDPDWINIGVPNLFSSGKTNIRFSVLRTNKRKTLIQCITTVNVVDKEPPIFYQCPNAVEVENADAYGVPVMWEEPIILDNVGIVTVTKSMEPNTTLTPGIHTVEYVAKDAAGNVATCLFEINVIGTSCSELADPENGHANCVDWMFGKMCQPTCDDGYMRNSTDSEYYTCNDSGIWNPSDIIPDCLTLR